MHLLLSIGGHALDPSLGHPVTAFAHHPSVHRCYFGRRQRLLVSWPLDCPLCVQMAPKSKKSQGAKLPVKGTAPA
eukprot:14095485-Alexandrium_andersonii.AAC.1